MKSIRRVRDLNRCRVGVRNGGVEACRAAVLARGRGRGRGSGPGRGCLAG